MSAWADSHGIRLLRYLDDWLVLASSEQEAKQAVWSLFSLCRTLAIVINEEKSDLVPLQTAKYLGMTIDTEASKAFPSLAQIEKFLTVAESFCTMTSPPGSALAGGPGSPGIARASGPSRSPSDALSAVASQGALVPRDGPSLSSGAFASGSETGSVLVDGEGSFDGGSIRKTCSGSAPVFGRVSVGVGRSPPRSTCVRGVVGPGKVVAHQSSRDEGPVLSAAGISRRRHWPSRDGDVRQLDGRGVRQQARGHGLLCPMLVGQPPSEMDGEPRHPSRCEVSSRSIQCPGRFPQPSWASCRDRVVSSPSGGEVTTSRVGQPIGRPLCDEPQRESAPLLLPSSGSTGRLRGCVSSTLGRPGCVRVSSLSSGESGDRPRSRVVAARDDPGRTPLAREGVVRRPSASTDSTTSRPPLVGHSASATSLQQLPPRRPRAEPSRVETLKRRF